MNHSQSGTTVASGSIEPVVNSAKPMPRDFSSSSMDCAATVATMNTLKNIPLSARKTSSEAPAAERQRDAGSRRGAEQRAAYQRAPYVRAAP